jgi:hypothetical protein
LGEFILKIKNNLSPTVIIELLKKQEFIEKIKDDDLVKIINKCLFDFFYYYGGDLQGFLLISTISERLEKNQELKQLLTKLQLESEIN